MQLRMKTLRLQESPISTQVRICGAQGSVSRPSRLYSSLSRLGSWSQAAGSAAYSGPQATTRPYNRLSVCTAAARSRLTGDSYPADFLSCREQVAAQATPGSLWPEANRLAFTAAAEATGGFWMLVQCGCWEDFTVSERTRREARAVMQVHVFRVQQGKAHLVHELTPNTAGDMVYHATAHVLDNNGWPTGEIYNSPSSFENLTTKKSNKKFAISCKIIWQGQEREIVQTWAKHTLTDPYGIEKAPPTHVRKLQDFLHRCFTAAGTRVLQKQDAVSMTREYSARKKALKQQAEQQQQQGGATATPAAGSQQALTGSRARRSRRT